MATTKKTSRRKSAKAGKARAKAKVKVKTKAKVKKKTAPKPAGRRVTIRLDVAFYPKKALDKASKAFAHLATIKITRKGSLHEIEFSGLSASLAARLPDEYTNFALSCSVVKP
ncbi:MAG: hypothetical protein JRJ87_22725 [Deltaproteobacteria bacterium]|nr:hypothetical protein [Deltaproteobacteria bacterium]